MDNINVFSAYSGVDWWQILLFLCYLGYKHETWHMHLLSQYKYLKPHTHFQNDPKQPLHNLGRFHGNQNKSYSNSNFFYIIRKLIQKEAKNIITVNVENDMVTIYRCFHYY